MSSRADKIQEKRDNTRTHKQEIENIKLDYEDIVHKYEDLKFEHEQTKQDAIDDINQLSVNCNKVIHLLEESTNFTTGKLKYDSNKIIELLRQLYKFPIFETNK